MSEPLRLLAHYAAAGEANREAWIDRPMKWDDLDGRALAKLHGHLVAEGWLEINLDSSTPRREGTVASCYRVTPAGLRALRTAGPGDDPHGGG
jgi:hypothetical protein